jgi:hypothetical protein
VYVRSFPNGEGKWRVSTNGGTARRWRRDGKELFQVERKKLMAVGVTAQPGFSPGTPAPLFGNSTLGYGSQCDVTANGKRFIVREKPVSGKPLAIHVAQTWSEEFRRLPQE